VSRPTETLTTAVDADGEVAWSWCPLLASRESRKVEPDRPEQLPRRRQDEFVSEESAL
jgi:hypothetical protein